MRKRLLQLGLALTTALGLTLAIGGVANADVPAIFAGSGAGGSCVGVILDQDGHYNVMDSFGNGYDALLCAPADTRSKFGWGHAGGYYMGPNHCVAEDAFINGAWQFVRNVCTSTRSLTRFLDSTFFYRIRIVT